MKKLHLIKLLALVCFAIFFSTWAIAQNGKKITGKVTAETGTGLAGVTVQIKGTNTATTTNENGNFSITVASDAATLVLSYVGYIKQEIALKNKSTVEITLQPEKNELSQVVVVGYGTVKKSDLTGSVVSVKADELKAVPATSFDQALQGRAAGVQVTTLSGKPGAETSIRIRGTTSINAGNEPLYVVDGMLISSDGGDMSTGVTLGPRIGPLSAINPNDIESIEILKDASATAIYGSRGANGVVIITTKRGRTGKGTVTLDSYYGVQTIANKVEVLNAAQFANLVNDAKINANQTPVYVNPKNLGEGTDWQDAVLRTAPMANYQLSFSGGDEKTKYSITGSYFTQDGIIQSSDFKRYSFRSNLDREVSKRLTVGTSITYARVTSNGVLTNAGTIVPGVVTDALLFNPILPVYDSTVTGGYTFENDRGKVLGNPVAEVNKYNSYSVSSRFLGNMYAKYKLLEGLEFKTSFGIDAFSSKENSYAPYYLKRAQASKGEASIGTVQGMTWLNENTLTYTHQAKNGNALTVLGGFTVQQFQNESLFAYAFDFPDDRTGYHSLAAALNPQKPFNNESQWSLVSFLGRVNYTVQDKYLFTLTGRSDGSSKFAEGNKYGYFPSGAFAWRVSKEKFMEPVKFISDLKLRASYGAIGNQAIAPYQSLALVGPYGEGVFNSSQGSEPYAGREPLSYVNKNLKWETTKQLDIGLDLSMFKNRVTITADYYHKKTVDLLLSTPIPTTSGFTSTLLNIGNIENKGFDFDIKTINTTGVVRWNTSINISINKNEITNLNSSTDIPLFGGIILRKGESIGTFYGYIFDGIFQSDAEAASSPVLVGQEQTSSNPASRAKAGDRKYRDINGDGKITSDDRTLLGSAQPDFTWGLNNTISFQNLDFSFFFQGSQGNKLANYNTFDLQNFTGQNNVLAEAGLNRWTPENPSNKYPRALSSGSLDVGVFSSNIVEDASYIRLKNVTLAYRLPYSILKKTGIQNLKLYAGATNLWTHTKYTGYDPEANTYGQSTTLIGIDLGGYPQTTTYTIGINAGF
ncbi:SusC/RagA family TonB-linked outer membrane protein [Limnovirga soli]|uniref:SusC/RagA family TonB-linked outer membrane protein n=1 Tax=Limnovirga soli TaxID=2656915 RepID=A0A8J8FH92_9BACT|nr:TonB-dependent receptor [Limnovirga soli]NNV55831.1 SusC/RagA family TonB-linked outer membrane protein [Limnovirga soli]